MKRMHIDNDGTTKKWARGKLPGEQSKAQQNFERDKESLEDYTVQLLGLVSHDINVSVLHAFLRHCQTIIDDDDEDN